MTYLAIDLKSFYASVECVERGLDPLDTNLVVADESRTEKTICLAVSPSLKEYGIPGRPRLFQVVQRMKEVNRERRSHAPGRILKGESYSAAELKQNSSLAASYLIAPPRMALYTKYSTEIYQRYLHYIAPEDIHVYSIDEVFLDVTHYLKAAGMTAYQFAETILEDVFRTTGITATAGIGTNLYLCKIAMDIMAKKQKPDKRGARIAFLDEETYRRELWNHTPLTDFWRVGKGYAKKLADNRLYTMGDIARFSLLQYGENRLYQLFGVNAELLIDHAWGWEPCTIADIKKYRPQTNSISSGQVLKAPYSFAQAELVVKEMTESMALELVDQGLVTRQMVLTVGYDVANLTDPGRNYQGETTVDAYGRRIPKHAHGTANLEQYTSSARLILAAVMQLYEKMTDKSLLIRRITLCAAGVIPEEEAEQETVQLDFFADSAEAEQERKMLEKEKTLQKTVLGIQKQFGKNAILKGMNLEEGATAQERNRQIGGHKA